MNTPKFLKSMTFSLTIISNVTPDGRLVSTRLFGTKIKFPGLISSLVGDKGLCYAVERSEFDLEKSQFDITMMNHSFSGKLHS